MLCGRGSRRYGEARKAGTASKTDPGLWNKVKERVTQDSKGGRPGQWSARKAQLATAEYKKSGGGYRGGKSSDNHLSQWTREDWGTKSGAESAQTGERYLPRQARQHLTDAEYERTTRRKQADTRQGRQVSRQPEDIARKISGDRDTGRASTSPARRPGTGRGLEALSRSELLERATRRGIPNRSRMRKAELVAALRRGGG